MRIAFRLRLQRDPGQDEAVKAAWSEVLNQYQRRADLVPNLVNTVKGYAAHEEKVLHQGDRGARQGRADAGHAADLSTIREELQQFQAAQGELSGALSRLMAVSENYPQLKADGLFQNLQAQLEGTENRITVARNRYIQAVQDYNTLHPQLPAQPDREDVRLQGQAELHGREREADLDRADGGFDTSTPATAGSAH